MFLKSIEIFGFKSFADRCLIEFRDDICALLGPNGCGKSNVVDALKWVIGEQSVKSLRAERMEDVIFSGSENRKALNIAEVTVVFSNDEGLLPLDFAEIAVKRRLYRNGESEYFLNNAPARLRELRELFFDTGIGKSAYSVMEQGKIDQILSSRPEERRYIFEEAAGITKYKARGAEAERKLQRTQENIRQVEGILGEVKRRYDSLKVQAEKTERYRNLRIESFHLDRDIQLLKLRNLLEQKDQAEKRCEKFIRERDGLRGEIDSINDFLQDNLDEVNSMETHLVEIQKKVYGMGLEKGSCENQISILLERREELTRQEKACLDKAEILGGKILSLKGQIAEKEKNLGEFARRIKETESNIADFERNITAGQERIKENEGEIRKREEETQSAEKEALVLQNQLNGITEDIVRQLDSRLKESGYSLQERKATEEKVETILREMVIQIDGKVKILQDASVLEGMDRRELQRKLEDGAEALETLRANLVVIGESFETYKKVIPTFIDEFLLPGGIITQKRRIDRLIDGAREKIDRYKREAQILGKENREFRGKIDEYRETLEALRVNRAQLVTRRRGIKGGYRTASGGFERPRRGGELENRLELDTCRHRIEKIKNQVKEKEGQLKELGRQEKSLQKKLGELERGIHRKEQGPHG